MQIGRELSEVSNNPLLAHMGNADTEGMSMIEWLWSCGSESYAVYLLKFVQSLLDPPRNGGRIAHEKKGLIFVCSASCLAAWVAQLFRQEEAVVVRAGLPADSRQGRTPEFTKFIEHCGPVLVSGCFGCSVCGIDQLRISQAIGMFGQAERTSAMK